MSDPLDKLLTLLEIPKKRDLAKHAREMTISGDDFVRLILACEHPASPYIHLIHHREILPDQLTLKPEDLQAFGAGVTKADVGGRVEGDALKVLTKVTQAFKDRRLLVGHIFVHKADGRWHFFYFDQRDYTVEDNHWEHGAHMHFINHLWPEHTLEGITSQFTTGNPKLAGSLHIRFLDPSERD